MEELALLRGDSLVLPCGITVHHPTLNEICNYGEEKYYQGLSTIIAVPQDFRVALYDIGVDCDEISEFELFMLLYKSFPETDVHMFFGELDLNSFEPYIDKRNETVVLYDPKSDILIDEFIHHQIIEFLRRIHGIEKTIKKAGNSATKKFLIELERQNMALAPKENFKSILVPQISALVNSPGFKYNYETCMDLPIYVFFDAVSRIQKIKHYDALIQGAYSGAVDLKKIGKEQLNWMG